MARGRKPKDFDRTHRESLRVDLCARIGQWKKSELSDEEMMNIYSESFQELETMTILDEELIPWFSISIFVSPNYLDKRVKKYTFMFSTAETQIRKRGITGDPNLEIDLPYGLTIDTESDRFPIDIINDIPYEMPNKQKLKDCLFHLALHLLTLEKIEKECPVYLEETSNQTDDEENSE